MNWIAGFAWKEYGIRYVYYNHGIGYGSLFSNIFEMAYMKIFGFLNRFSLKNADSAVSISKFMKSELKSETGLDSKVIYNRIDKRFNKRVDGNSVRKRLGLKNDDKLLFFIGRLSPHKNVHSLLKIFGIVNKKIPHSKLLIAGKPAFPAYYRKLREMPGSNVIFKDFIDDEELPKYYAACDLYVTASLWEGFDLPAAEAQACGKKVVAFDVCSHPEIVKKGVLVKKDDINGFADAVIKLLK